MFYFFSVFFSLFLVMGFTYVLSYFVTYSATLRAIKADRAEQERLNGGARIFTRRAKGD